MKTVNVEINEEIYEQIKIISENKKIPVDKLLSDIITKVVEEDLLLEKARNILNEEKDLLKRLA